MKPLREWIKNLFDDRPPRRIIFRVDAGRIPGLSFGHLARCLILSKVCKELYRSENIFLMQDYPEGINHAREAEETVKIFPQELSPLDEQTSILNVAAEVKPDWMVIDLPYSNLDTSYYPVLREQGTKILFIDDFRFANPGADAVLNSSIFAPAKTRIVPDEKTKYFLGPEYLIFEETVKDVSPIKKEGMINVVLTFGGSDPTGLTLKVLKTLSGKPWPQTFFRVILGPGNADHESVKSLLADQEQSFAIEINPPDIIPFFRGCDLAVCAGGRTMYELVHLNKKFLPIATTYIESEAIAEFLNQRLVSYGLTIWDGEDFLRIMKNIDHSLRNNSCEGKNYEYHR